MKQLFKHYLPHYKTIYNQPSLRFLGKHLHDPNLWHLNRVAISRAFAIGVFVAFLPIPFQMVLAALLAIFLRANLTLSIVLVWITNPITFPPILYFCYKVGHTLWPGKSMLSTHGTWGLLSNHFYLIWKPLVFGCLVVGSLASILAYVAIRLLWTLNIIRRFKTRKQIRHTD